MSGKKVSFLLLANLGKNNQFDFWANGKPQFDICINFFEHNENIETIKNKCTESFNFPGFKFPSLFHLFEKNDQLWDYDYYWFPDEDVKLETEQINQLFNWASDQKIWLGQPSLNKQNYSWPVTINNPKCKWRYVKMVEVMCPIFSKYALQKCYPTFVSSNSGWGLDAVWAKLLEYPTQKIAVYDLVKAFHVRRIDTKGGKMYKKLRAEKGLTPGKEMKRVLQKYSAHLDFSEYSIVLRE